MGIWRGALLSVWVAGVASAGPKAVAIASGDCRDPELLNGATAFSDAVQTQLKLDALDPSTVLEKLRPRPSAGLDDAQRQIDAAQSQFYSGQHDKALEGVRSALKSLERLAPSDNVFTQVVAARVLEGLILKGQNKKAEQAEPWKRVLRVQPDFKLDPDYHTPATLQAFDAVRKEVVKLKKVPLDVTSTPAGATVFLDGARVGKTPFKGSFPQGDYRLSVTQGETQSFVYDAHLDKTPVDVQIDLAFEGALRTQLPLCVNSKGVDFERALKLAARAGADQALVLRVESRNMEPGWVAAVLLDVAKGSRVREGGMKVAEARRGNGYAELAQFVLTGQPAKLSLDRAMNPPPVAAAAPTPSPVAAEPARVEPVESQPPLEPAPELVARPAGPSRIGAGRIVGAAVAVVGVGVGIAGIGIFAAGGSDRDKLAPYIDANGNAKPADGVTLENINALSAKVRDNRTTSLALGLTGAAVAVTGAVLFFVLGPGDAPAVSAVLTPNGAYASLTGSF